MYECRHQGGSISSWRGESLDSLAVYILARLGIALFRVLPRAAGAALIGALASVFYRLDRRHRRIADVNLRIAFPSLPKRARERIARRSFRNAALNLLEISRLPALSPANIPRLAVYDEVEGLDNYREARRRGKGILYLTGHFSSWELLPTAHALYGHPLAFTTRPLDNARLERYLSSIRSLHGNRVVPKGNSARTILRELHSGRDFGILMDQNTSPEEGIFARFFGVPAATTSSVALFALRTGAPVLPGYLTPMERGRYRIRFLPPMEAVRTGDKERDIEVNTQRFNDVLERIVREQPESWLWGHRRWKNQPPENPQDLYALSPGELAAFLRRVRP